jgi:hypothetical protein
MATLQNLITAGDTLDFTTSVPEYPASEGWTLKYRLAPRAAGAAIDITAAADGDDYDVQVVAATTIGWATGWYTWTAYVEKAAERYTVDRGQLEIRAASTTLAAGSDNRTHARKVLDAIESVIEGRATLDQQEYAIAGRSLKRMAIDELMRFRRIYQSEVKAEELAAGIGTARTLQVRL